MWEVEQPEAFAEVADYFQEQLDQHRLLGSIWPVCSEHDVGLHAEVHDGQAVWWCRLGDHAVATVGALDARFTGRAPVSRVSRTATYTRAYAESNGFLTLVPEDAVGDQAQGPHDANLLDCQRRYAEVTTTDACIAYLAAA